MTDVLLCVGHKGNGIIEYCGDGSKWGLHLAYSVESQPLGTGGAVIHALGMVRSPSVLILNGDTLLEGGLRKMMESHVAMCRQPVLGTVWVDDRSQYGSVTTDQTGVVTAFGEKADSSAGMIYAGCCVLSVDCLAEWRAAEAGHPLSLEREILPVLVRRETVHSHLLQGFFLDTGTPEDYRRAGVLYSRHG
jgi:NDP-sugar pyrophosphorylase family protein